MVAAQAGTQQATQGPTSLDFQLTNGKAYDPDGIYIDSVDSKGHYERVRIKLTPRMQYIIEAIVRGMKNRPPVQVERTRAVAAAIAAADVRDVVLLAGKGHEPYQEIAGVRHAYSDLDAAESALEARR